jgi:hypothetical protein
MGVEFSVISASALVQRDHHRPGATADGSRRGGMAVRRIRDKLASSLLRGEETMRGRLGGLLLAASIIAVAAAPARAADYMEKTDFQKSRAFSPAVVTDGGRIVWLAGQTAGTDEKGNSILGNFEA